MISAISPIKQNSLNDSSNKIFQKKIINLNFDKNLPQSTKAIDTFQKSDSISSSKISFSSKSPDIEVLRAELRELGETINYSDGVKKLQTKINAVREKASSNYPNPSSDSDPVSSFWDWATRN